MLIVCLGVMVKVVRNELEIGILEVVILEFIEKMIRIRLVEIFL